MVVTSGEFADSLGYTRRAVGYWISSALLPARRIPLRHYTDERINKTRRLRWLIDLDEIAPLLPLLLSAGSARKAGSALRRLAAARASRPAPGWGVPPSTVGVLRVETPQPARIDSESHLTHPSAQPTPNQAPARKSKYFGPKVYKNYGEGI